MCRFKVKQFLISIFCFSHFNTSHVSVQAICCNSTSLGSIYFNTSHVSVQDAKTLKMMNGTVVFQYISCVGSSDTPITYDYRRYHFNTSHVSVQAYLLNEEGGYAKFQYISCVGSSAKIRCYPIVVTKFQYISCVGSSIGARKSTR